MSVGRGHSNLVRQSASFATGTHQNIAGYDSVTEKRGVYGSVYSKRLRNGIQIFTRADGHYLYMLESSFGSQKPARRRGRRRRGRRPGATRVKPLPGYL